MKFYAFSLMALSVISSANFAYADVKCKEISKMIQVKDSNDITHDVEVLGIQISTSNGLYNESEWFGTLADVRQEAKAKCDAVLKENVCRVIKVNQVVGYSDQVVARNSAFLVSPGKEPKECDSVSACEIARANIAYRQVTLKAAILDQKLRRQIQSKIDYSKFKDSN